MRNKHCNAQKVREENVDNNCDTPINHPGKISYLCDIEFKKKIKNFPGCKGEKGFNYALLSCRPGNRRILIQKNMIAIYLSYASLSVYYNPIPSRYNS